jgi:hypothetical protein
LGFENTVLRGIFEPSRDKLTGRWRKFHSEELHNMYLSQKLIRMLESRKMRWVGRVARMGELKTSCRVLAGKSEGNRLLEIPIKRWEDNIKMHLWEIELEGVDWINLPRDMDR